MNCLCLIACESRKTGAKHRQSLLLASTFSESQWAVGCLPACQKSGPTHTHAVTRPAPPHGEPRTKVSMILQSAIFEHLVNEALDHGDQSVIVTIPKPMSLCKQPFSFGK